MQFIERDGMILRKRGGQQEDKRADGQPIWQYERGANHVHADMSAPDREHVRQELEIAAEFASALRAAYPERGFVIAHIPCYAVTFYQAVEDAPTSGVHVLGPAGDTVSCNTCGRSQPYLPLPVPDAEFPASEWGRCAVCGADCILGDVEILTFLAPIA